MSRQSHKPCPPPHFFLSLQKQLSMRLPPLANAGPHISYFCSTFFERPPAPVANASTSLPLLAAQADQALQPFFFFPRILQTMWPAAEASVKLPPPATCQRSKFSATKVLPTHRILPPPSKAPAIRRTTQPSPWLQYGDRQPSRTTAANISKRRSPPSPSPPRQQPPSPASSHAPSAEIGPWQKSVKFSPAPASLSHDVQASQISSPSTILSSPGNF